MGNQVFNFIIIITCNQYSIQYDQGDAQQSKGCLHITLAFHLQHLTAIEIIEKCTMFTILELKLCCTYKELISVGIVLGICEVPTQMMVSLEQEHPEGHLKTLLDSTAGPEAMRSRTLIRSHGVK